MIGSSMKRHRANVTWVQKSWRQTESWRHHFYDDRRAADSFRTKREKVKSLFNDVEKRHLQDEPWRHRFNELLTTLYLQFTNACNSQCHHCFYKERLDNFFIKFKEFYIWFCTWQLIFDATWTNLFSNRGYITLTPIIL